MSLRKKISEPFGQRGLVSVTSYEGAKSYEQLMQFHRNKDLEVPGVKKIDKQNLIVNTGAMAMAHLLGNDPNSGPIKYIAFGSGGVAAGTPAISDYQLNTEEFREPVTYKFNDGTPNFSVTFTAGALASDHPTVTQISELGLTLNPSVSAPTAATLDLFSYVTFPEVFFNADAPISMGLVVDWEIVFERYS